MSTGAIAGVVGALLAGTLLCAGVAKMAVPEHLSKTLRFLLPVLGQRSTSLVRMVASIEIGTAVALSVPAARDAGALAGIVLGTAFAVTGALAAARRASAPCGCFGRAAGRPLGLPNLAAGVAVIAFAVLLFVDRSGGWAEHDGLPMLSTATVALSLTGWLHRSMIRDLCRPLPPARSAAQTRSSG